jgi:hypothetical protein
MDEQASLISHPTTVRSWPNSASLSFNTEVHFPIVNDKPAGLHFQHGIPDAFLRPPTQVAGRQALSAA